MDLLGIGLILVAFAAVFGLALVVVAFFAIRAAVRRFSQRALHQVTSTVGGGLGLGGGVAGGALARIGERELSKGWNTFKQTLDRELLAGSPERLDRVMVKLAQRRKGEVAVVDAVAELEVPTHVARESLERLRSRDLCERRDDDGAGERFVFPAFKEQRSVKLCDYCESVFEPDEADSACLACGAPLRDGVTT